ncbi:MAG: hypothetical protein AAGF26_17570 [Cyanobacteria bacterium P01_G01_bin.49]
MKQDENLSIRQGIEFLLTYLAAVTEVGIAIDFNPYLLRGLAASTLP